MFQDLPLIQRTNEELSRVDRLFKEAGSGEQDESRASKCGLVRAPQPAAALELHYQAESKGGASTLHGLLPSSMCSKLVKRVRGPRWPYSHSGHRAPPPRPQHAPTTRRTQPARKLPGWRPSCAQRNTCNARGGGGECPVFLALTRRTSSGQRWPRVPSPRRFASCSGRLSSAPSQWQAVSTCVPECAFKHRGRQAGLECRRICTSTGGTNSGAWRRTSLVRFKHTSCTIWEGSSAEAPKDLRATAHIWPGIGGRGAANAEAKGNGDGGSGDGERRVMHWQARSA